MNSQASTAQTIHWWSKVNPLDWAFLPLRLFLGFTFVYAGIQKLTDPQFFNPRAIGYIGKQIISFAQGSPIHGLLIKLVPHAHLLGVAIIIAEIAIGLGTLLGFLMRPASLFGMLLSLVFFLSASWHVYPYFYGADIVFVFAWLTLLLAGPLHSVLPSLDGMWVPRFLSALSPETQSKLGRISSILLGVGGQSPIDPTGQATSSSAYNSGQNGYPQGASYNRQAVPQPLRSSYKAQIAARQRSMESRRNFLWGLVVGGLGVLGITLAGKILSIGGDDGAVQSPTDTGGSSSVQSTPNTGSGSSNAIAQVSSVPKNSAVTFTIPSNGDPGVLVHLNNDKFVCFDATCTHAGCPVSFDSGSSYLVCPCHGAEFDPSKNAAVVQGPAQTPLTSVPIKIDSSTGAITLQ